MYCTFGGSAKSMSGFIHVSCHAQSSHIYWTAERHMSWPAALYGLVVLVSLSFEVAMRTLLLSTILKRWFFSRRFALVLLGNPYCTSPLFKLLSQWVLVAMGTNFAFLVIPAQHGRYESSSAMCKIFWMLEALKTSIDLWGGQGMYATDKCVQEAIWGKRFCKQWLQDTESMYCWYVDVRWHSW